IVVLLLLTTTVATMFFAAEAPLSAVVIVATIVGGALAAGGANAINCYLDRDIDPLMARTRRRPVVTGQVPPRHALFFGVGCGVASFALLAVLVNLLTAVMALIGLLSYVFLYTLVLKRATIHNIVIGGVAGAIPPLVGWTAATGRLDFAAWYLFAIIFFWTPPHFWALALMTKSDYAAANIPMLPVVRGEEETRRQILLYAILMLPVTVLPYGGGIVGELYLIAGVALGLVFVWRAVTLYRQRTARSARALFSFSNTHLALLFVALVADRLIPVSLGG
ncbi:MAG: heme o synthase, partial [Dehalococcoidia bacterium]|nr:heme o synthase [Dehalococcoidia bacterium]